VPVVPVTPDPAPPAPVAPVEPAPAPVAPVPGGEAPAPVPPVATPEQDDVAKLKAEVETLFTAEKYAEAKAKAEQLVRLAPTDENKRTLDAINRQLGGGAPTTAGTGGAAAAPSTAGTASDTLIGDVAKKNEKIYAEVRAAIQDAYKYARAKQFVEALTLIDGAEDALKRRADNVGSANIRKELALAKQQVIGARDHGSEIGSSAGAAIAETATKQRFDAQEAVRLADKAQSQLSKGQFDEAAANADKARKLLPDNIAFEEQRRHVNAVAANIVIRKFVTALKNEDLILAGRHVEEHGKLVGTDSKAHQRLVAEYEKAKLSPHFRSLSQVSPKYAADAKKVQELTVIAKAQYLRGDYEGASATFKEVLYLQPNNAEAKYHLIHINKVLVPDREMNRENTRENMLGSLRNEWELPGVFYRDMPSQRADKAQDPLIGTLKKTVIPVANFRELPLTDVLRALVQLSETYSPTQQPVNINRMVREDPQNPPPNPAINISVRNMSLDQILDNVSRLSGYSWTVNNGQVEFSLDGGASDMETEIFDIAQSAQNRIRGVAPAQGAGGGGGGGFANAGSGGADGLVSTSNPEEEKYKSYFLSRGVSFDQNQFKGAILAFDGGKLTVTHNRKNLEKVRRIVELLNDVRQVSVQAKFIEVTQGTLKQLALNWRLQKYDPSNPKADNDGMIERAYTNLRTLSDAFPTTASGGSKGVIITPNNDVSTTTGAVIARAPTVTDIDGGLPSLPSKESTATSHTFDAVIGGISSWDMRLIVDAIEQAKGSDMLASPSILVQSDQDGEIKIVQELIYPENYDQPQMQNNGGSYNNGYGTTGGSAQFQAATPRDFKMREVGIILKVKPTVREGTSLIDLQLSPEVTEFEGFMEYGGKSVATVSGGSTVIVPSGIFQPVFNTRKVTTLVTIYDGATVVLGGLTREDVKTVEDKIPVLGDIPLIGAAFRSKGRLSEKKNLLIFVTATQVTPGGAPKRRVGNIGPETVYSTPSFLTPAGSQRRSILGGDNDAVPGSITAQQAAASEAAAAPAAPVPPAPPPGR
jgi:general secretion pathway protein D